MLTTVTSVDPPANSHSALVSTNVTATFDQNINPATATPKNFVVQSPTRPLAVTVSTTGATVIADPMSDFYPGELVQATATSGIQSTSAAPVVPRVWQFRTAVTRGSGVLSDTGQRLGDHNAFGVALGDLDGDGDLDAFVANGPIPGIPTSGPNRVWLNNGSGLFDPGQVVGDHYSLAVALGDLDGDGDLDAFVANRTANRVWLNNGGTFNDSNQILGGYISTDVALGDLDGDGDLDAFVTNVGGAQENRIWLNDGSGTFETPRYGVGNSASWGVSLGDLDGDGDLDVFVANDGGNRVWLNDGSAGLSDSGQGLGGSISTDVELGDLDGDGDLDAFTSNGRRFNEQPDRIWLNDGSAGFSDSGQALGSHISRGFSLGDLDGDGDLDAYVANVRLQDNRIWLNDGGIFSDSGQSLGNHASYEVALGDLDGDGDLDAFVPGARVPGVVEGPVGANQVWLDPSVNASTNLVIAATDTNKPEGDTGSTPFTFMVTRSGDLGAATSVQYAVAGSGLNPADAADFGGTFPSGVVNFAATEIEQVITIDVAGDTEVEADEGFTVTLSSPTPATTEITTSTATGTIMNDDNPSPMVTLSVDNATIPEAAGVATFTAMLSVTSSLSVTVDLAINGTATATNDYTVSGTQIVIPAGSASGSLTVTAVQDMLDEPDETVIASITSITNGQGSGQVTTTIIDDDEPSVPDVTLSVDNATIPEDAGVATFTVNLSEATTAPVTVDLGVSGTATVTADYTISATQIVVAAGATLGSLTVTAVQDTLEESDETVIVDIANVSGGTEVGTQQQTTTITDDDLPATPRVSSLTGTSTGFVAVFNSDLDTTSLNLYDTQSAGLGVADATLVGATSGPVSGSLVVDPPARSVTFIKTGDPLVADTYTVTLRSGDDSFRTTEGTLLDGDADGTPGGDFSETFTVAPPAANAVTISLPDFVRGPGQDVNVPADVTTGIPLSISEGASVRSAEIQIGFDPSLLAITAATVGAAMPAGAIVVLDISTAGTAILTFTSPADLPAGRNVLVNLQASIPTADASANYRRQQVLHIHSVAIADANANPIPAIADDALHLATYFADVSGNGRINASDASQVARFAALLESGFAGALLSDPLIVGDISGNRRINAADASLLAQFAALIPVDQIPPIPGGVVISGGSGPEGLGTPLLLRHQQNGKDNGEESRTFRFSTDAPADTTSVYYRVIDAVTADLVGAAAKVSGDADSYSVLEDALDELLSAFDQNALPGE